MLAPVLLFTYKRPDHTRMTLDALAKNFLAEQTHLFVFSDGPKNESDGFAIESVRKLVRETSGFASVTLIERSVNMGLARSIITGVTEILENHDSVIVLEDDLVTSKYFLTYMNNALDHYKNDLCAFSVTGHTFPEKFLHIPDNYPYDTYAGYRCSSWSWGTWRDRWQKVDWNMDYFPGFCQNVEEQDNFNRGGQDLVTLLRMQYNRQIDSWAIRFCYAHHANNMTCIYPVKTMVRNIGLDNSGTHSKPEARFFHAKLDESWLPSIYCKAHEIEPIIAENFRSVFAPAKPTKLQIIFRKLKSFGRTLIYKSRTFVGKLKRVFFKPIQSVDILVVNSFQKNGGAARAAYRTYQGIKRIHPNAHYLNLIKEELRADISGRYHWSLKGLMAFRMLFLDRIIMRRYPNRQKVTFTPAVCANPLRIPLARFNAHLVHLHWVAATMLRIEELGRLKVPVVWTLHDTWAFTGGCHYTGDCKGFTEQCGKCPQLASNDMNDLSHSVWLRKKKVFSQLNMTIVTPSHWLADVARKSSLVGNLRIEVIPNGLDTDKYKPLNKKYVKEYLNIVGDQPVLLFGAQWLTDPRKGGDLLYAALQKLDFQCTLLTFGEGKLQLESLPHVTVRSLGTLTDDISLAMMYSAADVFICPSREDNLPNTVAEAMACGTPCAAFNVNGLPDMIDHQNNGWLAQPFDFADLAKGIKWIVQHPQPELLQHAARKHALEEYSMDVMTQRYEKLYAELLGTAQK